MCIGASFTVSVSAASAEKLAVTKNDCNAVVAHVADAGVEYKPGVDVRGRPVVPADVGGSTQLNLPDEISIDIGIDLEEKYGLGSSGKYTGEGVIGKVTVKDGKAYFGKQPLDNAEQNAIAAACNEVYGKKP